MRITKKALAVGVSCGFAIMPVAAQDDQRDDTRRRSTARSIYLWSSAVGVQSASSGVDSATLGVWGNGAYEEDRRMLFEGAETLKITTRNFREGVRFDLKTPLDIEPYRASGYLRLRVRFREGSAAKAGGQGGGRRPARPGTGGFGDPGTDPGGFGGRGGVGLGDAQFRGNGQLGPLPPLGGMGGLGGEGGGEEAPVGPPPQETAIRHLLCTLVLDNGVMEGTMEIPKQRDNPQQIDLEKARPDANGWLLFAIPVKQMRSTPGANGLLRRLILSGDREDAFFLTQIALVVETGQMKVSIRQPSDAPGKQISEITVPPGPLTLVADVEAGAADPAIEWNFDADNVGNLPRVGDEKPAAGRDNTRVEFPVARAGAAVPRAPEGEDGVGAEAEAEVVVGPRIDARGLIARFEYPNEEQNYRVEVTVRDRSGKKEPVTASILVKVRG